MDEDNPNYPVMMGKIMKKESKFSDAKKVLERAASIDNGEAQYELGKMYFKGQGVEVNQEEAMRLFNKSQDNGCSKSSKFLRKRNLKFLHINAVKLKENQRQQIVKSLLVNVQLLCQRKV